MTFHPDPVDFLFVGLALGLIAGAYIAHRTYDRVIKKMIAYVEEKKLG
jgi:uncharacterized membrane protein YfcA